MNEDSYRILCRTSFFGVLMKGNLIVTFRATLAHMDSILKLEPDVGSMFVKIDRFDDL